MFHLLAKSVGAVLVFSTIVFAQQTRPQAELVVQTGHVGSEVYAVAFSPTGRVLASGADTVKLWDAASGLELRTLRGPAGYVASLAFSPDGNLLASGGSDNFLSLWDVASGKELFSLTKFEGFNTVSSVSFSADGRTLASGHWDGSVKLWDLSSRQLLTSFAADADKVRAVSFSPDGRFLASAGDDRAIKLWDVKGTRLITSLKGHQAAITSLAFSRDGKILASAGEDKIIKLWDPILGVERRQLTGHTAAIKSLSFSPDDTTLASASEDKTIKQWAVNNGELKATLVATDSLYAIAYAPHEPWLATGTGSTVQLWAADTGRTLQTFKGHVQAGSCAAFSADGKMLAVGTFAGDLQVWDLAGGQAPRVLKGHTDWIFGVAFSPDGSTIATVGGDNKVRIWDIGSGTAGPVLSVSDLRNYLSFSPDSKTLFGVDYGHTIKRWDHHSGQLIDEVPYSNENLKRFNLSEPPPDGLYNAISDRLMVRASPTGADLFDRKTAAWVCDLIIVDDRDWLVVSPKGFFDGSPQAWKRALWRLDNNTFKVVPVEAFFSDFFRPGLLQDIFAGNVPAEEIDISHKDIRQPSVKVSLADEPRTENSPAQNPRIVSLKIDISDAPAGAQDARLFRNGALVKAWRGDVMKGQSRSTVYAKVPVVAGDNVFTAYAFNHDNVKSNDATLTVTGADSLKRRGIAYVLAVGVNEYANPRYNLKYAVADAQDFAAQTKLQQEQVGHYERVEVIALTDKDATKINILKALSDLSAKIQPEDALVIFFAGHGTAQQNRFYLIPHDLGYAGSRTQLDARGLASILTHSISDEELERAVQGIDVAQMLLIIDACNSGQALEAEEKRRGPMNSKGLAQLAYEKGIYILTAAQSYQAANEAQKLGHGYLTYALVEEGLKTKAADKEPRDGQVLLREWLDYATERVPRMQQDELANQLRQGRQLDRIKFSESDSGSERSVQRPRVFYRRETEPHPLVVARP